MMETMQLITIQDIEVGQRAERTNTVTQEMVYAFADITGDKNPIHLNKEYAEGTFFKKQVAHGTLLTGLISAVLGMQLPGPGAIYVFQDLNFKKPVYFEDEITAFAEVITVDKEHNRVTFKTGCLNQNNEVVAEGSSILLPSKKQTHK